MATHLGPSQICSCTEPSRQHALYLEKPTWCACPASADVIAQALAICYPQVQTRYLWSRSTQKERPQSPPDAEVLAAAEVGAGGQGRAHLQRGAHRLQHAVAVRTWGGRLRVGVA